MIKIMVASRRRPGMTREEYRRYYQQIHAGKILAGPPELLQDMARYVQNEVLDGVYGASAVNLFPLTEFDSVSEICFPDPAAAARSTEYPYYRDVIQPDEPQFADESALVILMAAEEAAAVARPRNGGRKVLHFLKAAAGVSRDDFAKAWRDGHSRILQSARLSDRVTGSVRSHPLPIPADAGKGNFGGTPINVYDGVASLWFDRTGDGAPVRDYLEEFNAVLSAEVVDRERSFLLEVRALQAYPMISGYA